MFSNNLLPMIEEQAFIIALSKNNAVIEIKRQLSCRSCDAQSSCGTSSLSQLFAKRPSQFNLNISQNNAQKGLKVGDVIVIGLEDLSYLKVSLLIYILPIISLFLFALFAEQIMQVADIFVMLMGLVGLWFGFKIATTKVKSQQQLLTPQFIKKL